jgi:hypothetical protein
MLKMDTYTEYLIEIADALDNAPRDGAAVDEPEGDRYITLSDTLAQQWAQLLRWIASTNGDT